MLPTRPIQFVGGGLWLLAILLVLFGFTQLALIAFIAGAGCVLSKFLFKDKPKGPGDVS